MGSHAPRSPTKTNGAGEFVRKKVDLCGQLLTLPQVTKALRFVEFFSELTQSLLVGRARLWIEYFSCVAKSPGLIEWQVSVLKTLRIGDLLAETRTCAYQT